MLSFLIDTQLPPVLAEMFRYKGYDAKHTNEYPEGIFMSDSVISDYAEKEDRIIVSKDTDFLDLALLSKKNIKVLLIETGNIKNAELLELISKNLSIIEKQYELNNKLVIIQRDKIITL